MSLSNRHPWTRDRVEAMTVLELSAARRCLVHASGQGGVQAPATHGGAATPGVCDAKSSDYVATRTAPNLHHGKARTRIWP